MTSFKVCSLTVFAIMAPLFAVPATAAFISTAKSAGIASTRLNAWTLPKPTRSNPFGTVTVTWYDDHNPTARKVVYNDDDQAEPFRFVVSLGDDWTATTKQSTTESSEDDQPRRRSIRLAAIWAINRLRRFSS